MALYIAYNHAFSSGTDVSAGASYAGATAKCAIQLQIPSTLQVVIVEYGVSFDGTSANTPALVELVQASAASTMSTAHTTSTVVPIGQNQVVSSRLTFGATTNTGYGNGNITTNTTEAVFDKQYVAPTNQYIKQWPLGREPVADPSKFVQLRIKASTTVNAIGYIMWEEI